MIDIFVKITIVCIYGTWIDVENIIGICCESEARNQIRSMYNGLFDSMIESRAACIFMRL